MINLFVKIRTRIYSLYLSNGRSFLKFSIHNCRLFMVERRIFQILICVKRININYLCIAFSFIGCIRATIPAMALKGIGEANGSIKLFRVAVPIKCLNLFESKSERCPLNFMIFQLGCLNQQSPSHVWVKITRIRVTQQN